MIIPIPISPKFLPGSPIDNKPALVQVMAWHRTGNKPLPELMLTKFTDASGLDTNGCPLGNSKFIFLSDNLNICPWLSACQVEKIDQINNPRSTIYQRLGQLDLQCTHSCNFYLFHYALKRIKSDLRATLDPSMDDLLHIDSPEGILLVVDEDAMPTLTM